MSNPTIRDRFLGGIRIRKGKNNLIGYIFDSQYHIQKGIELTMTGNLGYTEKDENYRKEITSEYLLRYLGQRDLTLRENSCEWYARGTQNLLHTLIEAEEAIAKRDERIRGDNEAFDQISTMVKELYESMTKSSSTTVQPQKSEQSMEEQEKTQEKKSFLKRIFKL